MNPLTKLREEMAEALGYRGAVCMTFVTAQESALHARHMGDCRTALTVLDEFIAAHEAVEVDAFERDSGAPRRWFVPVDVPYIPGDPPGKQTIIVPRKQKPSLLAAAKAVEEWCRYTNYWRGMPVELHEKCDALAAAIKKAEAQGE